MLKTEAYKEQMVHTRKRMDMDLELPRTLRRTAPKYAVLGKGTTEIDRAVHPKIIMRNGCGCGNDTAAFLCQSRQESATRNVTATRQMSKSRVSNARLFSLSFDPGRRVEGRVQKLVPGLGTLSAG